MAIKTFLGEKRDLPWYVLSDDQSTKLNAFMVVVLAWAVIFLVVLTSIMTWLVVNGEYPISLLIVVYGVILLGICAVCKMCKTQKAFNRMMDRLDKS
ncbi:MAG: hypothetical protein KAS32_03100 [Candidatus Peribacteraceae bacterium]|nr:hypothetical protein [Candidatus Peribacteraceae bacterium]